MILQVSPQQAQLAVSGASVIFAGALVIVTYLYYVETQDQTEEMEATRKAEVMPYLKANFIGIGGGNFFLTIENTGRGAAHHVVANWGVDDVPDAHQTLKSPMMAPGDDFMFEIIPTKKRGVLSMNDNIEEKIDDENSDGILKFEATCEDILGNECSFEENIDIMEHLETRHDLSIDSDEEKIRKAVEDIEDSISDIERKI